MAETFIAAEFLGSDTSARVKKCHQFANEAEALANGASNPELRTAYLDLRRQWIELAEATGFEERFGEPTRSWSHADQWGATG